MKEMTIKQAEEIFDIVYDMQEKYREEIEEEEFYGNPYSGMDEAIKCEFKREMIKICKKYNFKYYPCDSGNDIAESIQYKIANFIKYNK